MVVNNEIEEFSSLAMKIRDKDLRKQLVAEVLLAKQRVNNLLELLRKAANSNINNEMLAKLNDLAYKGIRKAGVAKALDARAVKNEAMFEIVNVQVKNLAKKINVKRLMDKHGELVESLGSCPMSMNDTVECLAEADCFGICLQIGRSEATIMDPSKLVIKSIVPTYMSLDSFMESSVFNL